MPSNESMRPSQDAAFVTERVNEEQWYH